MVSERDRILSLTKYITSLGVEVNIGKNKARGNKGFFRAGNNNYRIDISKDLDDLSILKALSHEFAHYIHYKEDKSLVSLDFLQAKIDDDIMNELLDITVNLIPKNSIEPLFQLKQNISSEIVELTRALENLLKTSSIASDFCSLERYINKKDFAPLLKYDRVKLVSFLSIKYLDIKNIDAEKEVILYLKLKAKQRALRRIKNRISRLNRYYNKPTELWARSFEMYATDQLNFAKKYPLTYNLFENLRLSNKIPALTGYLEKIFLHS